MARIRPLAGALLVFGLSLVLSPGAAPAVAADTGPPTVTGADLVFPHPGRVLRYGTPAEAGLVPEHVDRMVADTARFTAPAPEHPLYPGAVVLAARHGVIVTHRAVGYAVRYASYQNGEPVELPPAERVPMRPDTIFDLASVSKLFTTLAALQQVERGRLDLDAPVARYLPAFAQHGKDAITIRQLLTHTSGLPAWLPLYRDWPTPEERIAAVLAVRPQAPPGTVYLYSDLNMITLGEVVEAVAGRSLDQVVHDGITGLLGLADTGYNPPAAKLDRIAATEYQPWTGRGMVRGSVHDENAWSLGGVAGHAGVFSTARDLAVLAQALLNGGRYGAVRILREDTVRLLFTDFNTAFPGHAHGLGFELDQRWYMDGLSSPVTAGHTGYTGTSLVLDPLSGSFVILLTNRVHPTRDWGSNNPARRAVAGDFALALPVRPPDGTPAWFSGVGDNRTATLTLPVALPEGGVARFRLWYDTEAGADTGVFEVTTDGGQSWQPVPLRLRAGRFAWTAEGAFSGFAGRRWTHAAAGLPPGTTAVRWRYTTDPGYGSRGVYVDAVRIFGPGLVFDDSRPADAARYQPVGWVRADA